MTLQQQLEGYVSSGTFTLPADALGSSGIQQIIDEFYANSQLVINEATVSANPAGTIVTITGTSSFISVNAIPATAVFESIGNDIVLTLTAIMPDDWTFSQSFTSLAGSFYDQLTLVDSSMILSSISQTTPTILAAGLNYDGSITDGLPEPLSLLLAQSVLIAGCIQIGNGVPTMNLALAPAISLTLGQLSLPTVNCFFTTLAVEVATSSESMWMSNNLITFDSDLTISGQLVPISGSYSVITENLSIEATSQTISLTSGLSDIFSLVDYTPDISWPALFNIENISLGNVSLSVSFSSTTTLDSFSFCIICHTWDLIQDIVKLDQIRVSIWIDNPFSSPQYGGQIYGQFLLGSKSNVILDIYAQIPASGTNQGWIFSGYSQPGIALPIGSVVADFESTFRVSLPDVFKSFTLTNLFLEFNTSPANVNGYFTLNFTIGTTPVELTANTSGTGSDESKSVGVSAQLLIAGNVFEVTLDTAPDASTFSASWSDAAAPLEFGDIASTFGWDDMPELPQDIDLGLTDAEFYYDFTGGTLVLSAHSVNYGQVLFASLVAPSTKTRVYLFALDIPLNLQLSNLPLVGAEMPADAQLGVQDLQVIVASASLAATDVAALNTLITGKLSDKTLIPTELGEGLTFATNLQMGSNTQSIIVPLISAATDSATNSVALDAASASCTDAPSCMPAATLNALVTTPAPAQSSPPAYQAGATWFNVEKRYGPVQFQRVGVQYQGGTLSFLLDATLSFSTLALSCDGLGVSSPLSAFLPEFHLDGIDIAFSSGPVTIDGGLLVVPTSQLPAGVDLEYTGEVAIQIEPWMISGVASYANISGTPSFFLFAQVTGDFGGPPAFFITGFMGGFGYNSQLALPTVDSVNTFPFVAGLDNPAIFGATPSPMSVLNVLSGGGGTPAIVTPTVGQSWLAAGVLFRSFELVFGRALAVVEFGQEFEIALLGLASTSLPQGATTDAYAYIELQLEAIVKPDAGLLSACGSLTQSSFVITKDCHLTGSFAFSYWFGTNPHAGDFVVVIGGYHPAFVVPAWYPQVSLLGFNWQDDSDVTIKGGAYFALTPSAIMAGGNLEVLFQSGCITAWFTAYANLLITWKPFHFVATIGISLGAAVRVDLLFTTVTISFELGATLDLWGPPTGGVIHVHLYIVSFSVGFGSSQNGAMPQPLPWSEFQTLLPQSATASPLVLGAQVNRGLVRLGADGTWYVRADELIFTTQTAVPATSFSFGAPSAPQLASGTAAVAPPTTIAIRPMGVPSATSAHTVTLTFLDDSDSNEGFSTWTQVPQLSNLPEALWGAPLATGGTPDASSATIPGLPTGVQLIAPPATIGNSPGAMDITSLVDSCGGGYAPLTPTTQGDPYPAPTVDTGAIDTISTTLDSRLAQSAQQSLIVALTAMQVAPPTSALLTQLAANAGQAFSQPPLLAA